MSGGMGASAAGGGDPRRASLVGEKTAIGGEGIVGQTRSSQHRLRDPNVTFEE